MRVPGQTSATAPGAATNAITIIRPRVIILLAKHFSGLSHRSHNWFPRLDYRFARCLILFDNPRTRSACCWSESQKISREIFFAIKYFFLVCCFFTNPCFHDDWLPSYAGSCYQTQRVPPRVPVSCIKRWWCPSVAYKRYRRWHPGWGQRTPADGTYTSVQCRQTHGWSQSLPLSEINCSHKTHLTDDCAQPAGAYNDTSNTKVG